MRALKTALLLSMFLVTAAMQAPEPPLLDTRLTIHTLVREDIFAGFISNDMTRFARGERSIETLLKDRPDQRPALLAWKGGAQFYRAIVALEAGRKDEFTKLYASVQENFTEARKLGPADQGVMATIGGSYMAFANRLPEPQRSAAWTIAYDHFLLLWKEQEKIVERLPVHMRGELLAGLAQSSRGSGRQADTTLYLEKIVTLLPDTAYAAVAKQWQSDPSSTASITCKSCHTPGRLAERLAVLNKK